MPRPKLHLDADASIRSLQRALVARGHDVTRTPNDWMALDASDDMQMMGAMGHGRILATFNVRDFATLANRYPQHRGIVLAAQRSWTLTDLIRALDRLLSVTTSAEWIGQVRRLSDWRQE